MTARSPRGARRIFPSTQLDVDEPVDNYFVRDAIGNNVVHAADCAARQWVNWVSPTSSVWGGGTVARYIQPATMVSGYNLVHQAGPFALTLFGDRTPYVLRVKLLGARSGGAGSVTFAVSVGVEAPPLLPDLALASPAQSVVFGAVSSTTPAWATPSTPSNGVIALDRSVVDATMIVGRETRFDDTGSERTLVLSAEATVYVWASTTDPVNSLARLHGLHVGEYVG